MLGVLISERMAKNLARQRPHPEVLRYARAARRQKLGVFFFSVQALKDQDTRLQGWIKVGNRWVRRSFQLPTVVHYLAKGAKSSERKRIRRLWHLLLSYSAPVNSRRGLSKWVTYRALRANPEVTMLQPDTIRGRNADDLRRMLAKHSAVMVKPDSGSLGIGISRVRIINGRSIAVRSSTRRQEERVSSIAHAYQKALRHARGSAVVIQEQIPLLRFKGRITDFRVQLNKNGQGQWVVSRSLLRIAKPNSIVANWSRGAHYTALRRARRIVGWVTEWQIYTAARWVAHALEKELGSMGELGLDFALDKNRRLWFLEANARPRKGSSRHIYRLLVEYAKYLTEEQATLPEQLV